MSATSLIGWCDSTWNPVSGCDMVSKGCLNCYAKVFAERFRGVPGHHYENGFDVQLWPHLLGLPLRWGPVKDGADGTRPRRIFVNSMSDLFHEDVPVSYIAKVFAVMHRCPLHRFELLTKRIERANEVLSSPDFWNRVAHGGPDGQRIVQHGNTDALFWAREYSNVLIGPTVEDRAMARKRYPATRALHDLGWRTMVSYEPALEDVDFDQWLAQDWFSSGEPCVDWLICGAESGTGRRPFDYAWARKALLSCRAAGVPFFMKQDSAFRSEVFETLPEDLKVREFPKALA